MKPKIVYILGYGRSGSTLLEIVLAANEAIESVGEFGNFDDWAENDDVCSCRRRPR